MNEKLNITQWAEEDRPREKMLLHGPAALSNAELLAILIGSGNTEETAVELMRKVLDDCHNRLSELGKRRKDEGPSERLRVRCSQDIFLYFHPLMCDLPVEECWVMLLNQAAKVIDTVKISRGGLASTQVDVRCILREALLKRATSMILCHNHPSGNIRPSQDDDRLTHALLEAARTMNIRLLDHVVVSDGDYYSYGDEGRL